MSKKIYIPTWLQVIERIRRDKGLSLSVLVNELEQVKPEYQDEFWDFYYRFNESGT